MRIVTAASYYGTGSSAVIDLLKEYNDYSLIGRGDYEIRFVQDPNGISDLYYNLVENNHRHNTSHAIKKFIKYAKYLNGDFYSKRYRKIFGNNFMQYTIDYINSLVQLKTKTWWHIDQIEKGRFINFLDICFSKIVTKITKAKESSSFFCRNEYGYYTYLSDEEFCNKTKDYLDKLFSSVCKTSNGVAEQLVPPSNVSRYKKFFKDLKVIVVERDPRDLYIISKEIYKTQIIPVKNVVDFCKWYKITREHRKYDSNEDYLLVQFEDMVYKYDETIRKIENYVGTSEKNHCQKYKYFNPEISKKGTRLFVDNGKYNKEIEYIERELKEYIYNYE